MAPLCSVFSVLALISAAAAAGAAAAPYKHVGVFSVDGLHASDLEKYVKVRPNSTIAMLLDQGYRYPNANTSAPSDSYPGSVAQFTAGTPRDTGVWYDVIYDRAIYPVGSNCTGPPGTQIADDETLDYNSTELFSGGINPANLPKYLVNGKCELFYPHNRVRVNTAFEVVRSKGLETAYCDKHPAYDIMRGPSGKGLTVGYFPEIAAIETDIPATIAYDKLHVQAFLDWLDAKTPAHSEGSLTKVPALFGGNFQAVSVAQKTVGYANKTGNPFSGPLLHALDFVDTSLGKVVAKLKANGLYEDTLLIVASKHGQAPIKRSLFNEVNPADLTTLAGVPMEPATTDDIGLLFLNDSSDTQTAVNNLNKNRAALKIFEIYATKGIKGTKSLEAHGFGNPATDPAVPDIIVVPHLGTVYTTSTSKVAEHGGLSNDDRNVACFASSPKLSKKVFDKHVSTKQVAPLILTALGIETTELEGVKLENVLPLPGF